MSATDPDRSSWGLVWPGMMVLGACQSCRKQYLPPARSINPRDDALLFIGQGSQPTFRDGRCLGLLLSSHSGMSLVKIDSPDLHKPAMGQRLCIIFPRIFHRVVQAAFPDRKAVKFLVTIVTVDVVGFHDGLDVPAFFPSGNFAAIISLRVDMQKFLYLLLTCLKRLGSLLSVHSRRSCRSSAPRFSACSWTLIGVFS